ncbi:MAG TPA: nuclear transport factor 2 family protein [Sphingomonadaceae bacterium]|nr:nuclear transport factor 2 family protein [Sphingomonadaceae bacterium]
MDEVERRLIEWECAQNTVRFYNRLDGARGKEAAALFAEDGIWYKMNSEEGYAGRAEIAEHVDTVRQRGNPDIPEAERLVFHLVCNVEVTVIDDNNAEVRANTIVIPGSRGGSADAAGWTRGISGVFPTIETHRRTAEGWKIATKRTSLAMRVKPVG